MKAHKDKVSIIILILIAVLTLASILNIIQKSASYHSGFSAKLIGIGFGLSLAVTVYVVMLADTAKTRWTAASFAAVFAIVSATIQTAMYLDESAPLAVAIAYGAGVPGFEAALAILEAMLRREVLEPPPPAAKVNTEPTAKATATTDSQQTATQPPAPTAKLSAKQIENIRQILQVVESGGSFATDAELADKLGWGETSARRYRSLAETQGIIYQNGDGRYHQKGGL